MLYLAIDQHRKQLTVNLRGEDGEVMTRRQVSTRGEEPRQFLEEVRRQVGESGYVAILEVCGFHDWLNELLPQVGCREVALMQAEPQSRRKTDRRDADQLGEILWISRARFLLGQLVLQVLKKDATTRKWYQRLKKRRGSRIARVAVMRRLTVAFWHMLKHQAPYDPAASRPAKRNLPGLPGPNKSPVNENNPS